MSAGRFSLFSALVFLSGGLCGAVAAAAGTVEVLHSFGEGDGEYSATEIVVDDAGNLYGTTTSGGAFNAGTVFRLSPDGDGWTEMILHHFTGFADGLNPYGGVAIDRSGNLYGTTVAGGTGGVCAEDGCGVVFKLTRSGSGYTYSTLYHFTGGEDGWGVGGQPAVDRGNLYGTTPNGGRFGLGVVWQLSPDGAGGYGFRVLHHFSGGHDGATGGLGRILVGPAGNSLYGVATVGGDEGAGTVYMLRRRDGGDWRFRTLHTFANTPLAGFPYGGVTMDRDGHLYGTTYYGGAFGEGTVYRLDRDDGVWRESVLHNFTGGDAGGWPTTNLVFDARGNLYGTTAEGGAPGCRCGTIFRLTPNGTGGWTHEVVYSFPGAPDAANSYYSITPDRRGSFYGATVHGGTDDDGTVFRFTP